MVVISQSRVQPASIAASRTASQQRSPDAAAFAQAPDRHQLALVAADRIRGEPGSLSVQERDEAGQPGRVDELPEPGCDRLRPALRLDLDSPGPVALGERLDFDHGPDILAPT